MRIKLHLIAALCGVLTATGAAQQPNQDATTWALVVGVSKYQKLPGGQQLQFADHDAVSFAEAIQKRGVNPRNVRLLTGAEATSAAIKSAIGNWLARSASESDTILIFFSGHGVFEREFGESYLLGYDSDPKDPYGSAISVSELGQALARRVRAGRVLLIADAARRDFFNPETDPSSAQSFEQAFDQLTASRSGLSAIFASGPGEFSREGQRWNGHGVFARHLVDVLTEGADRNGDGAVTGDELFDAVASRVSEDTSNKQHLWRSGGSLAQTAVVRVDRQNLATVDAKTAAPGFGSQSKPPAENKPIDAREQAVKSPSAGQPPKRDAATNEKVAAAGATSPPSVKLPSSNDAASPKKEVSTQPAPATEKENSPTPVPVRKVEPAANPVTSKNDNPVAPGSEKKVEIASTTAGGSPATPKSVMKTMDASNVAALKSEPLKPSPAPPATEPAKSMQPPARPNEIARVEAATAEIPAPPKPTINPPSTATVSSDRVSDSPATLSAPVPANRFEAAPSPLVLQLEAAIASRSLIEPKNASAWDYYQRLASEPGGASDAARLKPQLAAALATQGKGIVSGDVRSDNVSDKVDDFKRAGQMLARARSLTPENAGVVTLEKLSAATALISLQFFDEAERALMQLQSGRLASVENAMGLALQGKLDAWRAERAFKRAIEMDPKWAAPRYNLALLYRSQQNQASLAEFEAAASLDPGNVNLQTALGEEYFTRQDWKQAAETFRKAIALNPSDDGLHTKLGHALYSQGLHDEANREYQKARDLRGKQ